MTTAVGPEDPRDDELHCYHPDHLDDDGNDDGGGDWDDDECYHCECCCTCLGCEYGPRDGVGMTEEQRAPAAVIAEATS